MSAGSGILNRIKSAGNNAANRAAIGANQAVVNAANSAKQNAQNAVVDNVPGGQTAQRAVNAAKSLQKTASKVRTAVAATNTAVGWCWSTCLFLMSPPGWPILIICGLCCFLFYIVVRFRQEIISNSNGWATTAEASLKIHKIEVDCDMTIGRHFAEVGLQGVNTWASSALQGLGGNGGWFKENAERYGDRIYQRQVCAANTDLSSLEFTNGNLFKAALKNIPAAISTFKDIKGKLPK